MRNFIRYAVYCESFALQKKIFIIILVYALVVNQSHNQFVMQSGAAMAILFVSRVWRHCLHCVTFYSSRNRQVGFYYVLLLDK